MQRSIRKKPKRKQREGEKMNGTYSECNRHGANRVASEQISRAATLEEYDQRSGLLLIEM
jgi:hypothetical protein